MPSLIIHTDQSLNNIIEELDFKKIEETLKQVFIKILDAEEDKCQTIFSFKFVSIISFSKF